MTTEGDPDVNLADAYALDGPDASRSLYARWAPTYESGFVAQHRYVYPDSVVAVFIEHCASALAADDVIVDIGCGTGLVGEALRRRSDMTIDGLDISPEMLDQASLKQHDGLPVYRSLIEADLTRSLPLPDDSYGAALSVGTFTHGHVGPASLDLVLPILRPGARAAIGINAAHFAAVGFGDAFDRLSALGRIADLELIDVVIYDGDTDFTDPERFGRVAVFEIP